MFDSPGTLDYASVVSSVANLSQEGFSTAMPPTSESGFIGIELSESKLRAATVNHEGVVGERREAKLHPDGLVGKWPSWSATYVRTLTASRRWESLYRVWLTVKLIGSWLHETCLE